MTQKRQYPPQPPPPPPKSKSKPSQGTPSAVSNSSQTRTNSARKTTRKTPPPDNIEDSFLVISKEDVRTELENMGYAPDVLPEQMLEEFMEELKSVYQEELGKYLEEEQDFDDEDAEQLYESGEVEDQAYEDSFAGASAMSDMQSTRHAWSAQKNASQSSRPGANSIKRVPSPSTNRRNEEEQAHPSDSDSQPRSTAPLPASRRTNFATTQMTALERLAALDLSQVRETVSIQQRKRQEALYDGEFNAGYQQDESLGDDDQEDVSSVEISFDSEYDDDSHSNIYVPETTHRPTYPRSGFVRTSSTLYKSAPPQPLRKHDPVSRFHQHQAVWQRDGFLRRQNNQRAPPPPKYHLATRALGYVPTDENRIRHDMASLRNTYVPPTSKSRRDLVWDVRERLAQGDTAPDLTYSYR